MSIDVNVYFDMEPRWSERDIEHYADGTFGVGDVPFDSIVLARAHIDLRNALDLQLERLKELERDVEKVMALREGFRSEVQSLIDQLERHQDGESGELYETLCDEVFPSLAVYQRKSERAVRGQIDDAAALQRSLPNTLIAWMDGEIHIGHVRTLQAASAELDEEQLEEFESRVLPYASRKTPGQLRRLANRVARQLRTPTQEEQDDAAQDRAVWLTQQNDGMTHLTIKTSPALAAAAMDRLRQAFRERDAKDDRNLPQFMSDSAMALLITGATESADGAGFMAGLSPRVTVTMPATLLTNGKTLDGVSGAELPDGTLIDDKTALLLAAGATSWTRLFTDPVTGVAVTADIYQPTASLRRLIIGRDQTCRFPGCHQPASRADLDHTRDWQYGGPTTPANLAALCRRHHVLKHHLGPNAGWTVMQVRPGELVWIDPGGCRHRVKPEPVPTAMSPPSIEHPARALDTGWSLPSEPVPKEHVPF
ncbi:HNH endonuclease signature motif containing protein [uncultured Agrococcus sp.]|uniref:HNH endonuclease signature motif containing protein n=1 Tax=uncultured Agrococcus sp. TaxID=382258 RepID=UPI0025F2EA5C|nr:HNH endonuclease signature motif containing protein [uncultured Agrococcus sp.]